MIEFSQQTVSGDAWDTGLALFILFIFAIIASGYVLKEGLRKKEKTTHEILLKCVIIITSVVPRQFPMQVHSFCLFFFSIACPSITLSYLTLPYLTLSFLTLSYLVLSYPVLSYLVLPYLVLPYYTLLNLTLLFQPLPSLILPPLTSSYLTLPSSLYLDGDGSQHGTDGSDEGKILLLFVCVCERMHVCMCECMYVCMYVYVCMRMYVCMYVCVCASMCACVCVRVCECACICA